MHLIVVTPYPLVPTISGGRLRNRHLVQGLLDRGHIVDLWIVDPLEETVGDWPVSAPCLTTHASPGRPRRGRGAKLAALASRFPEAAWLSPPARIVPSALAGVDVAILCQAHVGRSMEILVAAGIPVILNTQNVESDLIRQLARISPTRLSRLRMRLDARKLDRFEARLLERASLVTAVSPVDAAKLQERAPAAHIEVLPSGADVAGIAWVDHAAIRADRLVLLGTLGYLPNLDGARWFSEEILPMIRRARPRAHVALVGSSPPAALHELLGPGVDLVGPVDEVAGELAGGDVFVAPLRAGSGVRLKLLEAFAHGIPVVATALAAEGLEVRDGVHLLIADDATSFASATVRLLEDQELRCRLSRAARELVEERYDWRSIGTLFEAMIASVVVSAART